MLGEYHPVRSRALAMGLFVSGINLGLVAGGTIAGGLGESYGWRSAILALGFTGLPVLGISYALLKGKPSSYGTETITQFACDSNLV